MEESSTYQAILMRGEARGEVLGEARGQVIEARCLLVRAARKRLGQPSAALQARIDAITSVERLEQMVENAYGIESWDDLLASA